MPCVSGAPSAQACRQPWPPWVSFRQGSRGRVVRRKAQPEMDPAFCYFCFLTKLGMALALRPHPPRGPCAWQAGGVGWTPSDGVTGGGRTTVGPATCPAFCLEGSIWEAELKVLLRTRHRHGLAAVILSGKETASLAFGRDELVAGRTQGAQVYAAKTRVFCPRCS